MIDRLRNFDICEFVTFVAGQNRFLMAVVASTAI